MNQLHETLIAVLDIGTSNIRASAVSLSGTVTAEFRSTFTKLSPTRGFVEFDAEELFQTCLRLMKSLLSETPCSAIALTNQRASAVVFDPVSKIPVCMGQSWQDLRTAPMCLALKASGISLSPNQSATKISLMMDLFDKDRSRGLLGGTIDAWICFRLTGEFKTDHTNAAMTGLVEPTVSRYDPTILSKLKIPIKALPEIVPSIGYLGEAEIDGLFLPLVAILGDQQASMLGQAITVPKRAKATFGTGAMVDILTGEQGPTTTARLSHGTFPIVARSKGDQILFGLEAIGLHAGSAVDFVCANLGIADSPASIEALARETHSRSNEVFVPALTGLATPYWDFGALACFANITHATTKSDLANATLAGVAHLGADLIEAIEADSQVALESLSVDGGMTQNQLFLQHLANFSQKRLRISSAKEATTVGAGLAGHLAMGTLPHISYIDEIISPIQIVDPERAFDMHQAEMSKDSWLKAVEISRNSVPELSTVTF
ncbi:MAG: FGGY family carbohydrate kinase [Actinomycetota bacterium]|nr:FGGY family carbohydrate kinase [Actinomycetota bacterium]